MAFKLGRINYNTVKNPVFSLVEKTNISADDAGSRDDDLFSIVSQGGEAGILKRRRNNKDYDPLLDVDKEAGEGESISELPLSNVSNVTAQDAHKINGNVLRPIRGAQNYEEISKIKSSLSPRASNYEEIAKGKSPNLTPRSPNCDELGKPKTPVSPLHLNLTGKTALPALVAIPKSILNLTDNVSSQKPKNVPLSENYKDVTQLSNQEEVCEAISEARRSNNYEVLSEFLGKMYSSFTEVLVVLKVNDNVPSNSAIKINMEYLDYIHESMIRMPKDVRKVILRSIINCMLQDHRGSKSIDDIRGFLVFLLNPLFTDSSTYVIYAHVLRQVACLENKEQQYLIMWFKKLLLKDFENVVTRLRRFISYRLFPTKNDIPEGEKSAWWIPNAIKVMAMLNAANDQCAPLLVPRKSFYVKGVEVLDLIRQYHLWQSGSQNFSFCQYPFVLSLNAKKLIIQKDSETKMLLEARHSLVKNCRQKQTPNMGMLFLNLHIRRKFLLEDSLREISKNQSDLKKKLRVIFTGEPGIDLGGVSKEWFFLITQKFFKEDYGMFTYNSKTHQWWFSMSCKENNQEYNLCGVLMGLAMYNGINLDIRFPMCVYKKLLSPAIVPFNNPHQPVGIAKFGIQDFCAVFPELGNGLKELLEYTGNVEEDLCQSFLVSFTEYGQMMTRYLKPDGDKIPVTNDNREEYVNMYINYLMNKSIYKQFYSFYHGFHSVCASNALLLLRPEEIETLVIGNPEFNMSDLEKITVYDGYTRADLVVRHFWDTVHDFSMKMKKKFLRFCTGSDRIPVGGMKEMKFKITRVIGANATHMLPMSHTCFNQLCLPPYKSRKLLVKKLSIAIENSEGFGLE